MISYAAALEIIRAAARPTAPRQIAPADGAGMTAAVDVRSAVPIPSFANAAMDGFALRSADTLHASAGAPVSFAIAGRIAAGQSAPPATPPGSAWEIMTGAPMPAGCDAVIPLERAEPVGAGPTSAIAVREPLQPGQNRREAGEDFRVDDPLLGAGDPLTPQAIMALAAVGCDSLPVRPPPRIAVIATGSELVSSGPPGTGSTIRDANGPYLAAYLAQLQMPLLARSTVPDDPDDLARAIEAAARTCDIILTTGGVSAGGLDFVPATIERIAGEILFHKVAIRPGKPLLFARLPGGQLLFGLPGNPMAVAVGLRFFVLPAARALLGREPERYLAARALEPVRRRHALTFFAKARAEVTADATLTVELLPGQESFKISPLLRANCWAIVPEGRQDVNAGDILQIAPLLPTDFPLGAP